jgi:hypothetical protein
VFEEMELSCWQCKQLFCESKDDMHNECSMSAFIGVGRGGGKDRPLSTIVTHHSQPQT